MAETTTWITVALAVAMAAYVLIKIKKGAENQSYTSQINALEKTAQFFSGSGNMESAIKQAASEYPSLGYSRIVQKLEQGIEAETALSQEMSSPQGFFSDSCALMLAAYRKNNPAMLFNSVQKLKEADDITRNRYAKSEVSSWVVQIVFCIILPLIYFFMMSMVGVTPDKYLNGLITGIVLLAVLSQGVVFRQWAEAAIKIPILGAVFYFVYFIAAPQFFAGFQFL